MARNKDLRLEPLTDTELAIIRAKYQQPRVKIRDIAKAHKRPSYLISFIVSNWLTAAEIDSRRTKKRAERHGPSTLFR